MSIRFILGRSGSGKTKYILDQIQEEVQNNDTSPVVLLVPEQYTFEAEKKISKLFLGQKKDKYLRSRVLSFKTMSSIIFSKVGGLTDTNINSSGISMMTYRAIQDVSDNLEIFSKSSSQQGFVGTIIDAISEFKQYNISPDMIETISEDIENETLKLKLKDISKIYQEYEDKLHENYIDSQDMLNNLAKKINQCDYFRDAHIYIDEFTGFTPVQYSILKSIMKSAKKVTIALTIDTVTGFTYNKSDPFSRTKLTYNKLIDICREEDIKVLPSINLNHEQIHRFKDNKELTHLEKYYNSYPYKKYEEETNNIKIKEFNNLYSEIEYIAKEIVKLVREENVRYKDITIATRDLDRYDFLISSIFREYKIPNFIDKKREAKTNPIIVLIVSALEMRSKRYSYETMFRYLKSGLINITKEEISLLENYVLANGIQGKKWFEERWEYSFNNDIEAKDSEYDIEIRDKVNEIKSKVIEPIQKLQSNIKGRNKVADICNYVYEFLLDINIPKTIEDYIEYFKSKDELEISNQYSQVWNIVIDILDQMIEIMGEDKLTLDQFVKVISLGFDEYELGIVPPSIDQVLVSSVDRMKNSQTKHLYLIGTIDGVFPLISKDSGLLNDEDRSLLVNKGIEVDVDSTTKAFEEQYLIYKALTHSSEKVTISYPISDHEGKSLRPSIIVSRLKKIFINIDNKSYLIDQDLNTQEEIIDNISVKSPTFNSLITKLKDFNQGNEINPVWLEIYRYYLNDEEYRDVTNKVLLGLNYTNKVNKIEKEKIRSLYDMNLSVSKLERYAQCPFAYFIQYGLKAKERKEYSFTAPDLGVFIHTILDMFSKKMGEDNKKWNEIDSSYIQNNVAAIVQIIVSKIPGYILESSSRYKYLTYRLTNMLVTAITIISQQIKNGLFEPVGYEMSFGNNGDYPPIKLILRDGEEINLRGKIDRVDSFVNEDKEYIRIVDYKSSSKEINLTHVFHGLQLQLLVYIDAILESNKNKGIDTKPAAILYSKIDDPIISSNENKEDEEIREEILKSSKMNGLLIKDINVIKYMDNTLESGERSKSLIIPAEIKKDGTLSKNTKAVSDEEFKTIRKYVKTLINDICEEMLDGNIDITPYKEKDKHACEYCQYSAICKFDATLTDNNYKVINKKKDDEILIKMKGDEK